MRANADVSEARSFAHCVSLVLSYIISAGPLGCCILGCNLYEDVLHFKHQFICIHPLAISELNNSDAYELLFIDNHKHQACACLVFPTFEITDACAHALCFLLLKLLMHV